MIRNLRTLAMLTTSRKPDQQFVTHVKACQEALTANHVVDPLYVESLSGMLPACPDVTKDPVSCGYSEFFPTCQHRIDKIGQVMRTFSGDQRGERAAQLAGLS